MLDISAEAFQVPVGQRTTFVGVFRRSKHMRIIGPANCASPLRSGGSR